MRGYTDPFPIDSPGETVEKMSHNFLPDGQRVRIKRTGHTGKITAIATMGNRIHVQLDSGHSVHVDPSEIEPEDFPLGEREKQPASAGKSFSKVSGGFCDPFSLDTAEPATAERPSHAALEMLSPFLGKAQAGLSRALDDGRVSVHDRVLIKIAIENIAAHRVNLDPLDLGDNEESNVRTLRIMAEKYAGSDTGETLAKSANNAGVFFVGQRVRDRLNGRFAKIIAITSGVIHVLYDDGGAGTSVSKFMEAAA